MLSELRKSVNYIIYERTTSPFWGAFIFSWLICNWKIVFTVFVINENQLSINKIDYISRCFIDWKPLILYPFFSTLILVGIFPVLGNGAYWVTLKYSKWRLDKKNEVEKQQLLSIEQSIALRNSFRERESILMKLLDDKDGEIKSQKIEIDELNNRLSEPGQVLIDRLSENKRKKQFDVWTEEFENFSQTPVYDKFQSLLTSIVYSVHIDNYNIDTQALIYFTSNDLINLENSKYELTEKGKFFSKLFSERKYS